ncbi:MAG: glycosyltransferase [Sulfitobacter sp.]
MGKSSHTFRDPRIDRGLTDRVFADPSKRRRGRILYSALMLLTAIFAWIFIFSIALVSTQELEAALPDDVVTLKGHFHQTDSHDHRELSTDYNAEIAAIDVYHQQEALEYRCLPDGADQKVDHNNAVHRIYAMLPSALPWAAQSLQQSCDVIDVIMPAWFDVQLGADQVEVVGLEDDARKEMREYVAARKGRVDVMPVVAFSQAVARLFGDPIGRSEITTALNGFIEQAGETDELSGLCIDASSLITEGSSAFASFIQPLSDGMRAHGLQSCVVLPGSAPDGMFVVANRFSDVVVAKVFEEPWVGSAPQPIAADDWFDRRVESVQTIVDPAKLVIAMGTFSVDWTSGSPKPKTIPFAEAMAIMVAAKTKPKYEPIAGNAQSVFVDAKGMQHRMWMLDAASAHNQLMVLKKRGVQSAAIWSLGSEDPGLWAVLDQADKAQALNAESLNNLVFANYVDHLGDGPFVAPISMPVVGQRVVQIDPQTNRILTLDYTQLPQPSVVRLYGGGQTNKVVLTFDDGPHKKHTPATLEVLKSTDTPGTFFVLGSSAIKAPELVERILEEGHEIGSHTYSHHHMGDLSAGRAIVEVNSVQLLVNGITGKNMRLYREPYMRSGGPITSKEVASLMPLEKAGYIIAGMDIVPGDWLDRSADELAKEMITQVEENAGGVILLHDGGGDQSEMVKSLPVVIKTLREKGYVFTSMADFLETTPETLLPNAEGMQSTFNNVSFKAVGNGWSLLELIFWTVLVIGLVRAIVLLLLTALRKRHVGPDTQDLPSVTVVIPAFNEANVIGRCIDYVLATDYADFDVIVVDDGSNDDTYAAAMAFADHPLVNVITQHNQGKAAAMNAALFETDSDVLICIDADSQLHPQAVGLMAAHFSDPKIGAVAGRVVVGNRTNILTRLQALEYITAQSIERRAKEVLNAITVVPGAIGAWRTNALMEAGIFSTETLTEDADMTMAIIRSDYRVIYEDRAVAVTETPATVGGLMAQRLRWCLGMMQAGWKHLGAIIEGRNLGLISLPDLAIFGYLMPLIAPLADLLLLILIYDYFAGGGTVPQDDATLSTGSFLLAYMALPIFEVITVAIAFRLDPKEDRRLMLLIPFQRIIYRQLLYFSVIRALWRASSGSLANWGRGNRTGFQFDQSKLT